MAKKKLRYLVHQQMLLVVLHVRGRILPDEEECEDVDGSAYDLRSGHGDVVHELIELEFSCQIEVDHFEQNVVENAFCT